MLPVLKEINLGRDGDAVHTIIEYYCVLSPSHATALQRLYGKSESDARARNTGSVPNIEAVQIFRGY